MIIRLKLNMYEFESFALSFIAVEFDVFTKIFL